MIDYIFCVLNYWLNKISTFFKNYENQAIKNGDWREDITKQHKTELVINLMIILLMFRCRIWGTTETHHSCNVATQVQCF